MATQTNPWQDYFKQIYQGLGTPGQNPFSQMTQKYLGGAQITAPQLGVNPMDVVTSTRPLIEQGMQENFAKAGQRFGAQGMLASTPYMGELGRQSAQASNQLGSLYYNTLTGAAENQANRALQAAMANQNASLRSAELTQAGANPWFGLAGQMAGLGAQESQFGRAQEQQAKQFAQQMGLDYDQLNQQQKQFLAAQAQQQGQFTSAQGQQQGQFTAAQGQQASQFGQTLGFQQEQAKTGKELDWFNRFFQWVSAGGDPNQFFQYGGQGANPSKGRSGMTYLAPGGGR